MVEGEKLMQGNLSQSSITAELTLKLPVLRASFNISQTELGNLIGKSRQQISKIERGITPLGWDTCLAIVMVLHNKDELMFNNIMGKDYYAQVTGLINSFEIENT